MEISKAPIVVAVIASALFCVDCVLTKFVWAHFDASLGRGFMWVAFVSWTISFGMNATDKIRMWSSGFIGFASGVGMVFCGKMFGAQIFGIAIASLIGVFVFNAMVMYLENFKKVSITGIFVGILLVFSGLGVNLSPDTVANGGIMFVIIAVYGVLGCLCAFASTYFIGKWKKPSRSTSGQ